MRRMFGLLAILAAGQVAAQQAADSVAPEAESAGGFAGLPASLTAAMAAKADGQVVEAKTWMVAAANPHAVKAGADVLDGGGCLGRGSGGLGLG